MQEHSRVWSDATRSSFVEQQRTTRGPIPMTLGWHIGTGGMGVFLFKEGGGGGFHSVMRIYPSYRVGAIVMSNATGFDVEALLDTVDRLVVAGAS